LIAQSALQRVRHFRQPWLWSLVLLALPIAWPDSKLRWILKGGRPIEAELASSQSDGYYERLMKGRATRLATDAAPPRWRTFADSGLVQVASDYQRWRLRPSVDVHWNGTVFRTNSLGIRGEEVLRKKPDGVFRLVVLGSSNTLGHGVHDVDVYTRQLERRLRATGIADRPIEVINLAVSGDSPTQKLLRLRDQASELDPDWLLCDVTAIDFSLEERHLRWVLDRGVKIPFDFVQTAIVASGASREDSPAVFHSKFSRFAQGVLDRTFANWSAESRRLGAPLTVLMLPRADSKTETPQLFTLFRELAQRHELGVLDLTGIFDEMPLDDYRIGAWDPHPNARGHGLIAENLASALLNDREFAARLSNRDLEEEGPSVITKQLDRTNPRTRRRTSGRKLLLVA
jgi:lysophospholipase L1-like esterase